MAAFYTEADYENSVIELFRDMGYDYVYGPNIVRNFNSALYDEVLEESLRKINKGAPYDAIEEALYKLRNFENGELVQKNGIFMDYLYICNLNCIFVLWGSIILLLLIF